MQNSLKIVLAIDDKSGKYWINLVVAVASIVKHATEKVELHILHNKNLSQDSKQVLRKLHNFLYFHEIKLTGVEAFFGDYSEASLYRLLIPEIFENEQEVLYVDSDTVCFGLDLTSIRGRLGSARLAAVIDPFIAISKIQKESLAIQKIEVERYFNSGILLLNPSKLPKNQIKEFIKYSNKGFKLIHPDQDYLNYAYQNELIVLDEKYNYQVCIYQQRLFHNLEHYHGKMLHYVGKTKPSEGNLCPATIPFWMYAESFVGVLIEKDIMICEQFRYLYKIPNDIHSIKRTLVDNNRYDK